MSAIYNNLTTSLDKKLVFILKSLYIYIYLYICATDEHSGLFLENGKHSPQLFESKWRAFHSVYAT